MILDRLRVLLSGTGVTAAPSSTSGSSPTVTSRVAGDAPASAVEHYLGRALGLATDRVAELKALAAHGEPWQGWREFEVAGRVVEADHQVSFYLKPTDGRPIPSFKPGQFLSFKVLVAGKEEIRAYSLSDAPRPDHYRITVKRALAPEQGLPHGKVSAFFQDELAVGARLQVKAPAGTFTLDTAKDTPVVMIAGGVGATPFVSMLAALAEEGSSRPVTFFYAAKKPSELMMRGQLDEIAKKLPGLRLVFVVSSAEGGAWPEGVDHIGHINMELLKHYLPKGHYEFYMCGPTGMMAALTAAFKKAGVADRHIHSESFGAAPAAKPSSREVSLGVDAAPVEVHFVGAGTALEWRPDSGTLLEAAEKAGVNIPWMCRQGSCKACQCSLRSGQVTYPSGDPGAPAGKILPCVAVPLAGEPVVIQEPEY